MIEYQGDVGFVHQAIEKVLDNLGLEKIHSPSLGKVRDCEPLRRLSTIASNCAGNSPDHLESAIDHARHEMLTLHVAFEAGKLIYGVLEDALEMHKCKEPIE